MRDYNIESDLKQEKFEVIKLVQGDKGNKLTINVLEDGKPVSLTGCSITAKYKRADGQVINGSVTNISNNSFDAVIDSDITKVSGVLKMLFSIEKDDVKVSTFLLLADVREGLLENTGSSGGGEVTVDLKDYQKKTDNGLETKNKYIVGAINEVNSQCKDIAKKVENVGQPTQEQINNVFKNGGVKCNSNYNNPLEDLNIVIFGDSISDERYDKTGKWVQPFRDMITCKSLTNYSRGGCWWTFKSGTVYDISDNMNGFSANNVIWNQLNKLKNDIDNGTVNIPDVLMILAGTNDAIRGASLGDTSAFTSTSQGTDVTTLTTLTQSVRYVCDEIYNNYPNCKIIIFTPLPIASAYTSGVNVRNKLIECSNILGLDCIDQTYKSGIVWYREVNQNIYLRDKIHLNELGGELVANFIYKELLNLPCFYEKTVKSINLSTTESTKTLDSINATFSQGNNAIYTTDSLDVLKQYLIVKANYSDNTSENITNYTLRGTLTTGTSVITVSYNNKTTIFNVIVTEKNIPITNYTITNNLTNATNSNSLSSIEEGNSYTAKITANTGYKLSTITVSMGGTDITNTVYSYGNINISNVTGNIIITVTTVEAVETELFNSLSETSQMTYDISKSNLIPGVIAPGCKDNGKSSLSGMTITKIKFNFKKTGIITLGKIDMSQAGTGSVTLSDTKQFTVNTIGEQELELNYVLGENETIGFGVSGDTANPTFVSKTTLSVVDGDSFRTGYVKNTSLTMICAIYGY